MRWIWGVVLGLALAGIASAQTAVPAYEGGGLAWDYPSGAANHGGFRLTFDGVAGNTQIGKDVRSILFSATTLKGQPFKQYTARLVATATAPGTNSAAAVLVFDYQARPQLVPPTGFKTILEWVP